MAQKPKPNPKKPHYKVRVSMGGSLIHLASTDEPQFFGGEGLHDEEWHADWIEDPDYGDTIGWIDWSAISAITWRYSKQ